MAPAINENQKLQTLLDAGLTIPKKVWSIDATKGVTISKPGVYDFQGGTIAVEPNDQKGYKTLRVMGNNITLKNLIIIGDRARHKGTEGEWGHGVHFSESKNVKINHVTAQDCWGDGFYVGDRVSGLLMQSCTAHNNRRQGLSIVGTCSDLQIYRCTFKNTNGTRPEDGIDIEPDKEDPTTVMKNITISECIFAKNLGAHIEVAGKKGKLSNIVLKNNKFDNSCKPTKIDGVPNASKYQPSLIGKAMGYTGNYSGYPKDMVIK